jgi:hypothetical protein
VVTGPNTVVEAIAAGRRAAAMMKRYLCGEPLEGSLEPSRPRVYVEPVKVTDEEARAERAEPPTAPLQLRQRSFVEVELSLTDDSARREARRCLRCDLDFTSPEKQQPEPAAEAVGATGGSS